MNSDVRASFLFSFDTSTEDRTDLLKLLINQKQASHERLGERNKMDLHPDEKMARASNVT